MEIPECTSVCILFRWSTFHTYDFAPRAPKTRIDSFNVLFLMWGMTTNLKKTNELSRDVTGADNGSGNTSDMCGLKKRKDGGKHREKALTGCGRSGDEKHGSVGSRLRQVFNPDARESKGGSGAGDSISR